MLKQIPVSKLRLGMYIHRIDAAWLEHPFWKKRFLLENHRDLQAIRSNRIKTVWIDIRKGCDVSAQAPHRQSGTPSADHARPARQTASWQALSESAGMPDHYREAQELCVHASSTIKDLSQNLSKGEGVDPAVTNDLVVRIQQSVEKHPSALISVLRIRDADQYTYMHSVAVCALMAALSRTLGLSEAEQMEAATAGLLHDVGKLSIDPSILNKPGRLTDDEFRQIQLHPDAGYLLLMLNDDVPPAALDVCLHHHEKFDGTGYPHGLEGEEISKLARMGALCDVYDAVTSNRPYKKGWNPAEALHRMAHWEGHFDPLLFKAFVRTVGGYPVGSLVILQGGELAVVTAQHPHELLLPRIRLLNTSKAQQTERKTLDLSALRGRTHIRTFAPQPDWDTYGTQHLWLSPGTGRNKILSTGPTSGLLRST